MHKYVHRSIMVITGTQGLQQIDPPWSPAPVNPPRIARRYAEARHHQLRAQMPAIGDETRSPDHGILPSTHHPLDHHDPHRLADHYSHSLCCCWLLLFRRQTQRGYCPPTTLLTSHFLLQVQRRACSGHQRQCASRTSSNLLAQMTDSNTPSRISLARCQRHLQKLLRSDRNSHSCSHLLTGVSVAFSAFPSQFLTFGQLPLQILVLPSLSQQGPTRP